MAENENSEPVVVRLSEFLSYKGLNANSLAGELGYKSSEKLSRLFRIKGAKPSLDIIKDVSNKFEEFSIEWWINGVGNMIKKSKQTQSNDKEFNSPKVVVTDSDGTEQILLLDSKAAAGFPLHINDSDYYKNLPTLKLPKIKEGSGTYICVEVQGNSMEPTILQNQWVVGKFEEDPFNNLRGGEICLIVTKSGVVCKRFYIKDKKRGVIECVSDNEDFSTFELIQSDYLQVYKYICDINFNSRNSNSDLRKDIKGLDRRISLIEKHLKI